MPKMSDTMTEGTIAAWLKKVGDEVKSGDILAEVETDKATMELESYWDGVLLHIGPKEGESVEVDGVLAVVGEKGADFEILIKAHQSKVSSTSESPVPAVEEIRTTTSAPPAPSGPASTPATAPSVGTGDNGRVKASPLAKKVAAEKGYDISQIQGTGDGGRIIKRDVEAFTPSAATSTSTEGATISLPQIVGQESFEDIPVSPMRKTIAKRLSESKFTAPHFYLTMEINMDKAVEARKSINEVARIKISFNDIIIKATAAALRLHPKVNVSWLGG